MRLRVCLSVRTCVCVCLHEWAVRRCRKKKKKAHLSQHALETSRVTVPSVSPVMKKPESQSELASNEAARAANQSKV